jgi:hypothetical protein
MGTRSLTYVYDGETPVVCMYRQFDGYPEGHGREVASFLEELNMVNGLSMGETRRVANGMGCLAAQLVTTFKKDAGGFYLHSPILGREDWQDYEYHIFEDKVKVYSGTYTESGENVIFEGSWLDYIIWCEPNEPEDE